MVFTLGRRDAVPLSNFLPSLSISYTQERRISFLPFARRVEGTHGDSEHLIEEDVF